MSEPSATFRLRMGLAFAAVYLIWGSTYLAIRFTIETLPPLSSAGVRFLLAGSMLYGWARWRGASPPTLRHWRSTATMGGLLLLGGNGAVVWAEQRLSSGLAALLVGTEPLWIAVLFWFWPGGRRPSLRVAAGLVAGFAGAALLSLTAENRGGTEVHIPSVLVVLFGCVSWATGSLYGRRAEMPDSQALTTGMQMLCGGALLFTAGGLNGEWWTFELGAASLTSLAAFVYLVFIGGILAYSSYVWLVRNVEPSLVATYAYVNPAVAVFLGWLLAGEPIGPTTLIAMVLIIGAVVLVSGAGARRRRKALSTDYAVEKCA